MILFPRLKRLCSESWDHPFSRDEKFKKSMKAALSDVCSELFVKRGAIEEPSFDFSVLPLQKSRSKLEGSRKAITRSPKIICTWSNLLRGISKRT
jgi:hypothetical protein